MVTQKYRVILADPPWDYRNGGNGSAKNHYPSMTIEQICALPVGNLAADDCLLLLWATWPQVEGASRPFDGWDVWGNEVETTIGLFSLPTKD